MIKSIYFLIKQVQMSLGQILPEFRSRDMPMRRALGSWVKILEDCSFSPVVVGTYINDTIWTERFEHNYYTVRKANIHNQCEERGYKLYLPPANGVNVIMVK